MIELVLHDWSLISKKRLRYYITFSRKRNYVSCFFPQKHAFTARSRDYGALLTAFPLDESLFLCYIRTICLKPRAAGHLNRLSGPVAARETSSSPEKAS
ncbi:MAG: hypothetical protein IJT68_09815 [Lentisphaeria bacterium]|nr:hypothetical protein [Lentisphaeria bacterium]MBR3505420.1 hypothetical protein [Lentisphaeria bacterium]